MSFTICEPYHSHIELNKLFVDGYPVDRDIRPLWYITAGTADGENVLDDLASVISDIESNNTNQLIIAEKVARTADNSTYRLSGEYLAKNTLRNWIMLDIDDVEGSTLSSTSTLEDCVEFVTSKAPELLTGVGMTVQASAKRGLETFSKRVSIRIFVELSEPQTNAQLKKLLRPYIKTRLIDDVFTLGRQHLVRPPEIRGTIKRKINGASLLRIHGDKLDIQALRNREEYQELQNLSDTAVTVYNNIRTSYKANKLKEELDALAKEETADGDNFFDHNRHAEHYNFKSRIMWVLQDMSLADDIIMSNSRILGKNRTQKDLDTQSAFIHNKNKQYFKMLEDYNYDDKLPDPEMLYLPDADLSPLFNKISDNYDNQIKTIATIKSPHASGKTTYLINEIKDILRSKLGRKPRLLYISTTRAINRSQAVKLKISCYIDDKDEISQQYILDQDELAICLLSIQLLAGGKAFDLIALDESEGLGMWAAWKAYNHNNLIDWCQQAKVTLLLDADAGTMTNMLAERINKNNEFNTLLLENTQSYIGNQHLTFIQTEASAYVKAREIYDEGGAVWVHTDLSDKSVSQKMTALAKVYNNHARKDVAIAINAQMEKTLRIKIQNNPNKAIEELYRQGYRIFLVSPIIGSGWRYDGQYAFTATIGIYASTTPFVTAPSIVQAMQRLYPKQHPITQHYMYVTPASTYVPDTLEQQYLEEYDRLETLQYAIKINRQRAIDDIEYLYGDEDVQPNLNIPIENRLQLRQEDSELLKAKAKTLKSLQLSNVKLHLFYYWQQWGGGITFEEIDDTKKKLYKEFRQLLDNEAERIRRQTAEELFNNKEELHYFCQYFLQLDGQTVTPETIEDIEKLLIQKDTYKINAREASEIATIISTPKATRIEDLRYTALHGPKSVKSITRKLKGKLETVDEDYLGNIDDTSFYPQLGKLIFGLIDAIELQNKDIIIEMLLKGKTIVIDTEELATNYDYKNIKAKYGHVLSDRLNLFNKKMSATNFIKKMFTDCFLADVSYVDKETTISLVTAKANLIQLYQSKGLIKKTKGGVNQKIANCKKHLERKLQSNSPLDEIEEEYLEASTKFMVVTPSQVLPEALRDALMLLLMKRKEKQSPGDLQDTLQQSGCYKE